MKTMQSRFCALWLAAGSIVAPTVHAGLLPNPLYQHEKQQLYWVNATPLIGGIYAGAADGSTPAKKIITLPDSPDAVAVDKAAKRLYFTNMSLLNANDANVQRADIVNGRLANIVNVVPKGSGLKTPKQLVLDEASGKLYFADREGRKIFRAPMSGVKVPSDLEVLVDFTALPQDQHQFVGIALDSTRSEFYWTDRLTNTIWRARTDLGVTITLDNLSQYASPIHSYAQGMLIELALDLQNRYLYFSDRGEGNELIGATLPAGFIARIDLANPLAGAEMLVTGLLKDPVGIHVSPETGFLFYSTSEDGKIFRKPLNGGPAELIHNSYPLSEGMDFVDWNQ